MVCGQGSGGVGVRIGVEDRGDNLSAGVWGV